MKRISLPLPESLEAQRVIVKSIDANTGGIDQTIVTTRREVELLIEFRSRLTSDVATGQVDVREIAATLPEFIDQELFADGEGRLSDEPIESGLE